MMVSRSWRAAAFLEGMLQTVLLYPVKVCPILIWMLDGSVCITACLVPSVFSLLPISNLMDHVPDLNGHEWCFQWEIFRLNTSWNALDTFTADLKPANLVWFHVFHFPHPWQIKKPLSGLQKVMKNEHWKLFRIKCNNAALCKDFKDEWVCFGIVKDVWAQDKLHNFSLILWMLDGYNLVAKDFQALGWIHPGWKVIGHLLLCYGLLPEPPSF